MSLLSIRDLVVDYGATRAVDGVSFELEPGATLGIAGESGSGKSQTALAILGLQRGARVGGSIVFDGSELAGATDDQLNRVRGARIGMVFQDPMTSLNPYRTIGAQLAEVLQVHRGATRSEALASATRMLDAVRIAEAPRRLGQYPHQLSGGLRQRVMIAGALLCRPRLLIADEPTTALDMTVQAQLIDLLAELQRDLGMALLLISHDFGVLAELCARLLVFHRGRIVEAGATTALLARPEHPYTQGLLQARAALDGTVP
jgi:oligopeptide transport system ATP-binding protein